MEKAVFIFLGIILIMVFWLLYKSSHGFWNDKDGLTIVDLLAFVLGFSVIGVYLYFNNIDDNFADIVIATILASAGQFVGVRWTKNNKSKINTDQQDDQYFNDINNKI